MLTAPGWYSSKHFNERGKNEDDASVVVVPGIGKTKSVVMMVMVVGKNPLALIYVLSILYNR